MHGESGAILMLILLGLGTGLLFVALAVPLILGRVPRNLWYGFRVPKTLASDRVWYPANRYLGQRMFNGGRLTVAGSLVVWALWAAFGLSEDVVAVAIVALLVLPVLVAMVRSFQFLKRL
jgi:hypothetical protein